MAAFRRSRGRAALVGVALLLVGCEGVQLVGAKDYAVRACNKWTTAIDPGTPPDQIEKHWRDATDSAKTASEMDSQYQVLSGAISQMAEQRTGGDFNKFMSANDTAFDECDKATGASEKLREEIEKQQRKS